MIPGFRPRPDESVRYPYHPVIFRSEEIRIRHVRHGSRPPDIMPVIGESASISCAYEDVRHLSIVKADDDNGGYTCAGNSPAPGTCNETWPIMGIRLHAHMNSNDGTEDDAKGTVPESV